jgi:hypothetical protein
LARVSYTAPESKVLMALVGGEISGSCSTTSGAKS